MTIDFESVMMLLLVFAFMALLIGTVYAIGKSGEKVEELEKRIIKLEAIIEERRI